LPRHGAATFRIINESLRFGWEPSFRRDANGPAQRGQMASNPESRAERAAEFRVHAKTRAE
jgi:hypothetical protein